MTKKTFCIYAKLNNVLTLNTLKLRLILKFETFFQPSSVTARTSEFISDSLE